MLTFILILCVYVCHLVHLNMTMNMRFAGLHLLVVDEISMCHADLWNQITVNLKAAGMWDHVHVVTMGDMCQLPPPNKYKALYEDFVLKARNPQAFASKLTRLNGIKSFETMKKMELTVQKRAQNDLDHTERITQLRTGEIDDNIINGLKPLTREDTQHGWEFVPVLVTSNCERVLINRFEYRVLQCVRIWTCLTLYQGAFDYIWCCDVVSSCACYLCVCYTMLCRVGRESG